MPATTPQANVQSIPDFSHVIDQTRLERLAGLALKVGLNLQSGQDLIINAPLEALPLVRLLTRHAYAMGAGLVTTFYRDDAAILLRYRHAHDHSFDRAAGWLYEGMGKAVSGGVARLVILGDDPNLLAGQNPEHIVRENKAFSLARLPLMAPTMNFTAPWTIIGYPTLKWAQTVFPDADAETAVSQLAEAIFSTSRVSHDDFLMEWQQHNAGLHARCATLNAKRFSALHFRNAAGTDLTVGLADDHSWQGGSSHTKMGIDCNANLPTEEVFTTPHRGRINGTAVSTKPLAWMGSIIDGIKVRFADGKIVEATATSGEDTLKRILATDDGASFLGEVALVPHSSPISQSGTLFYEILYDENAACHIAIGQCYSKCFTNPDWSTDEITARGGNQSMIHIDWMIGSADMDIDGIHADGTREPLFRGGEWADS